MDEELRPRQAGGEATPEGPSSTRPRIEFDEINLPEVLDKTQEALAACAAPLFQRSGYLVHVYRLDRDSAKHETVRRKTGAPPSGQPCMDRSGGCHLVETWTRCAAPVAFR